MLDEKDLQTIQSMFTESEARMLEQSAQITQGLIAESEARILEQSAQITQKLIAESEVRVLAQSEKLIAESEARVLAQSEKLIAESEARMLEQSAHNTRVILESYVEPKFQLLAENQQTIMELMTPKSEIEDLRGEIDLLKMVVRTMSADIAELKKAQ